MFELTETMYPLMMVAFLVALGGAILIRILFPVFFGAKMKRKKISAGFVLSALFLAPPLEEFILRGPIWVVADGEFSFLVWTVIGVLGIFFGLLHGIISRKEREESYEKINGAGIIAAMIGTTLLGVTLGWLVVATDSLLPAMIVHGAYNLAVLSLRAVIRSIKNT